MVVDDIQRAVAGHVRGMVGGGTPMAPREPGDAGLIARDSVAWRVHGDFTAMMIGGTAALLIQMLHPSALAGVWDHSNFPGDPSGRLRRTAQFIGGTTFGSTAHAMAQIALVRRIHDRIHGTLPDGTPYDANDPELLNFVHVAGGISFVDAYRRYRAPLSRAEQDRYFVETATIARGLGATDVPETRGAADALLRRIAPGLRADERTRTMVAAIMNPPAPNPAFAPAMQTMLWAGVDLLPDWAAAMHGLRVAPHRRLAARAGAAGVGTVLRWALNGTASDDRKR